MATSSSQILLHDYTFRPKIWKPITDSVFEVYTPTIGCIDIEIVFFHGFHTNDHSDAYYRTWMKGDSSGCWLDTWLVERFPQARILSVSYDVSLMMSAFTGQHDIYPYGENLVSSLVELAGVGQSCPVVLVAHCVGGLVLKEICLQAEKFAAVKSIYEPSPYETFLKYVKVAFFYSTPNFGSRVRMEGISGQDGPMLQNLALLTTRFAKVNAAFTDLRKRYGWRTFGATSANETPMYLHDMEKSHDQMESVPRSTYSEDQGKSGEDMDYFHIIQGVGHISICTPHEITAKSFVLLTTVLEQQEYEVQLQPSFGLHFSIQNFDHRVEQVIKMLQMEKKECIRLALVGMDGVGKSTLAKQVQLTLRDQFVYTCFVEVTEFCQMQKNKEVEKLVAQNLRYQNGRKVELNEGEHAYDVLRGRNVLIIVDDVESEDQICSLLCSTWCGEGSRLIITSNREDWAHQFIVHRIPFLSEKASHELFESHLETSVLGSISRMLISKVVSNCDRLPLMLEVIGKYLRDKQQETIWCDALKRLESAGSTVGHPGSIVVWKKLRVSFDCLPELERNMFLDLATFDSYGPGMKHNDLRILKSAWERISHKESDSSIDVGLVNLEQRSLVRIIRPKHAQYTIHVKSFLTEPSTIHLHKQLREMGKWISGPRDESPVAGRNLWRLKDVAYVMSSKWKGDQSHTQVLSVTMEDLDSGASSQRQEGESPLQWKAISNLTGLRFLKLSNLNITRYESYLTFPRNLTLLHMENCSELHPSRTEGWWSNQHCWPIRRENIECLDRLSVLILDNCSPVYFPENFHKLPKLKILKIRSSRISLEPLPSQFHFPRALEHLSLNVSWKNLPHSVLQLPSLESMVLTGHHFETLPTPTTDVKCSYSHLITLRSLKLLDLPLLSKLPESFGRMMSLEYLSVVKCFALQNLPESFGNLQQLKELKIQDCSRLETLCESFSQLGGLRKLKLRHLPALRRLPGSFGHLPSIQEMRLQFCHTIKELPESFVELRRARVEIYRCDGLEGLCSNRGQFSIRDGWKDSNGFFNLSFFKALGDKYHMFQFVSFRSKWRSDLTALGFGSFEDVFNPRRIACLFTDQSTEESAIEMIFLHVEGMALFIGVGLPYAKVSFQADGIVKVQEIQESTWSELWMESNINKYKLMLLDSTTWTPYTSPSPPEKSRRGRTWSIGDAAERFGVGVEGMNVVKEVGYHPEFCQPTPRSPYWMEVFYRLLSQTGEAESQTSEGNSKDAGVRLHPTQIDSSISDVNLNRNDHTSKECDHGEAICVDQIPDEKQQPLKLCVIIYLDGNTCQYIDSNAIKSEISKQQQESTSSRWELIETPSERSQSSETHSQPSQSHSQPSQSCVEVKGINGSKDFQLTPTITVRFLYHPSGERGMAQRKIETNLHVHYYLEGDIDEKDIFGWYHDELRLSFTCEEPEKVHLGKREIHSEVETRDIVEGHSHAASNLKEAEKSTGWKLFAGHRTYANVECRQNSQTGTKRESSMKEDREFRLPTKCLVGTNFHIREVGRASELAYRATIFPPLDFFDKWNPSDRNLLRIGGIMSMVLLQVEGEWSIREEPVSETPPHDHSTRSECCPYEFSCQRKLILDEIIPQKSTNKNWVERYVDKVIQKTIPIKTTIIKQTLTKKFLINHTFNHMQGLKRGFDYQWNLVGRPKAPCPIDPVIS